MVLLAAAALTLTSCGLLHEDAGEKNVSINLPPIVSAAGNTRSISADRLPALKDEVRKYRVTVNGMTREGTGSSYDFRLAVGVRAKVTVECLNSSGEVIVRAVRDFTVMARDNNVNINLKTDGTEIIPASAAGRVTYSWGEADRHGNKSGIPSDPATYKEGDVFEVKDGSVIQWQHGNFTSWSANPAIEPENGGQATNAPQAGGKYKMPKGGVTLTAQWNKRQYSITYQTNEANSGGTATGSVPGTSSVEALASANISSDTPPQVSTPTATYTFTGWNTQAGGSGMPYSSGQQIAMMTEDIMLYAQWTSANVYTVTYNIGSGNVPQTSAVTNWKASDTYTVGTSSAITLPTLSATGYTFNGWQINGAPQQGGTAYTPTQSVTATAQWTPAQYTVTYNIGSGNVPQTSATTGWKASDTYTVGTTAITLPALSATGYTFGGWQINGATQQGGTTYTPTQSVTATAQWTPAQYTVTYSVGTGNVPQTSAVTNWKASDTYTVGTSSAITLPTLTAIGYTFNGWQINGATQQGGTAYTPTASVTATAQWTPAQYTVTYNIGSGNVPQTSAVTNWKANDTYTVGTTAITLPTLSATGYTFGGWQINGATQQGGTAYTPTASVTATAVWTAGQYTVTYSVGNGNVPQTSAVTNWKANDTYTVGTSSAITMPTLTAIGYTFNGWQINGATQQGGTAYTPTASVTATAQWTEKTYTITYNSNNGSGTASGGVTSFNINIANVTLHTTGLTRQGYTFAGWSNQQNSLTAISNVDAATLIGYAGNGTSITLYAVWEMVRKTNKADWEVGDIVLCDSTNSIPMPIIAIHPNAYADRQTGYDGVAVVYKNENNKVYIVGKVHEKDNLEWCLDTAQGYSQTATLVTEMDNNTAGQLTFKAGTYTDGSTGLAVIQALGDYNQTNYPAWYWANNYGTTQRLSGDLANNWYLPSLAELFDIWKSNSDSSGAVENALTVAGGITFGTGYYWSSSTYSTDEAYALGFENGKKSEYIKTAIGKGVCAVRQFTY